MRLKPRDQSQTKRRPGRPRPLHLRMTHSKRAWIPLAKKSWPINPSTPKTKLPNAGNPQSSVTKYQHGAFRCRWRALTVGVRDLPIAVAQAAIFAPGLACIVFTSCLSRWLGISRRLLRRGPIWRASEALPDRALPAPSAACRGAAKPVFLEGAPDCGRYCGVSSLVRSIVSMAPQDLCQ